MTAAAGSIVVSVGLTAVSMAPGSVARGGKPSRKCLPSGRIQNPEGSITSGIAGNAVGQLSTNTVRREG
jgi:hypothetical protein